MPSPGEILEALEREAARSLSIWRRLTAAQLLVASFLVLVTFGTTLLLALPGLYTGERLSFVDALFTATSAVCVTGLVVVDTATYFTPLGQAVLLLLIQLGGLGILTLTTLVILMLGRPLTLRAEAVVGASAALPHIKAGQLIRGIIGYTLAIELVGAFLLWLAWTPRFSALDALWPALFHAISAFCNAGFSVFSESLVRVSGDALGLVIMMGLIVLGGLGFLVLEELHLWRWGRGGVRVSLHTRLVLVATLILVAGGALLFAALEWTNTLAAFPAALRPVHALFLSITPRTAGFNTVGYAELTNASLLLTMILMIIGGSPGSTAGGLKTTTVALLVALALARLRGRVATSAFRRTIPEGTIQRAIGLAVFVLVLVNAALLILQITEVGSLPHSQAQGRFLQLAFEAASAFNTVGLSMGITPDLSAAGRVILAMLMFVGRVGPLTLVASMAVAAERRVVRLRYATEDVVVG
ncbi:MAG: potassium transporter TrkH [Gemmatimonadetes bacterium]|nr:potassium transporter TrkH [Gemmatimonadota bacterium]